MSTTSDFAIELKHIKVSGVVSVERVSKIQPINGGYEYCDVFVLLGPTGSGKSSFIEAVASNTSLGLSSDKLEGFTKSVSIYRIINAVTTLGSPIYLVDVPGFADSKISGMSIVSMLKDMIQTNLHLGGFRILYHTPINTPRLPGSQRQVLRTFEALTGPQSARNVTIVSTMWDSIWNENTRRRAEGNFSQLRDEMWEDYIAQGANIVKFYNTPESALTILDNAFDRGRLIDFIVQRSIRLPLRETPFASHIHDDLQTRIHDLQMQQATIQLELQMATEQSDEKLEAILIAQLEQVQMLFAKFKEELHELGTPADRLGILLPINNTAASMPGSLPTPELIVSSTPKPVTSIPATKSLKGGIFTRATNELKQWGNKLSKHRASD